MPDSLPDKPPPSKPKTASDIILLPKLTPSSKPFKRPIPYAKFHLALDCCGSFVQHFSIDKLSPQGREGRELLMVLLEPLLGTGLDYPGLMNAVNSYCQTKRYKESGEGEASENVRRFLEVVKEGWGRNKKRTKVEEEGMKKVVIREGSEKGLRGRSFSGGKKIPRKRIRGVRGSELVVPLQGRKTGIQPTLKKAYI